MTRVNNVKIGCFFETVDEMQLKAFATSKAILPKDKDLPVKGLAQGGVKDEYQKENQKGLQNR